MISWHDTSCYKTCGSKLITQKITNLCYNKMAYFFTLNCIKPAKNSLYGKKKKCITASSSESVAACCHIPRSIYACIYTDSAGSVLPVNPVFSYFIETESLSLAHTHRWETNPLWTCGGKEIKTNASQNQLLRDLKYDRSLIKLIIINNKAPLLKMNECIENKRPKENVIVQLLLQKHIYRNREDQVDQRFNKANDL